MITLSSTATSMWYILPSDSLRRLVIRRMIAKRPWINYVLVYKDANGFGVHMTHVDWVMPGHVYGLSGYPIKTA